MRRRPVAQSTLQSEDFPEIPEGEPRGHTWEDTRSAPIAIPIREQPIYINEPLRSSPEPASSLRPVTNGRPTTPEYDVDLSMAIEQLRRNPTLLRQFSALFENAPSEYSAANTENNSHGSTVRPSETSSTHRRRDNQGTSQSTPRQEPVEPHHPLPWPSLARDRTDSLLSSNGTHNLWLQLDHLSPPTSPPQSPPAIGNLIGLFPSYSHLTTRFLRRRRNL
jgi:hypothetical protein